MKFTKKALKGINVKENNFKKMIKSYLLSYGNTEEVKSHMQEIVEYGCQSGVVTFAIYTKDNEKNFKKYCIEIMQMLQDYKEECGEISFELEIDYIMWFAIEETVREFLNEMEVEY